MNDIRSKIWYFLVDAKTNELLSFFVARKYQKMDLAFNIFLVITTSSSVAAWTIWQQLPILWALIIGVSQVMTLVKPYFLFPKYIKVFNQKSIQWQNLSVELEELWFKLNEGIISKKEEAVEKYFDLKKKSLPFDNVPDDIIFFKHEKLQAEAESGCEDYLKKI